MIETVKTTLRGWISGLAGIMEILISLLVLAAIAAAGATLIGELGIFGGQPLSFANFAQFLDHALWLVIGVEFIKMLVKHTPGAAIEVLLFAIARQLIAGHPTPLEMLFGVLSIAGVFAVRRYLFIHAFEEAERYVFPASKTLRQVNRRTMTAAPGDPDAPLGGLMRGWLEQDGEQIREGAAVSFSNVILRIHKMRGNDIESVEVIPVGEP